RRLQVRQLTPSPENDGPEADLDQMDDDDPHEKAEEEDGAAKCVRRRDDVMGVGEPAYEYQHRHALNDHAACEQRDGEQGKRREPASSGAGPMNARESPSSGPDWQKHAPGDGRSYQIMSRPQRSCRSHLSQPCRNGASSAP